ncbi:radical SAM family heme chaperone HemW [Haloglycomyces albus]|uniref:radical SAM family heme chaperone HemW n=1 Tax=Haloglycomyces albus TaxID=526067 RepID=UPI00046CDDAB
MPTIDRIASSYTPQGRGFGFYVHVPFCASRCGYCDFNTYTAAELGSAVRVSRHNYVEYVCAEIDRAARCFDEPPTIDTIFFGGGTPTLLPAADLVAIVDRLAAAFGLADDVEVTTEANPESVDRDYLATLRSGGFNRVSIGMQSTASRVLRVLERSHTPGRALEVVDEARGAGFDHVSLDLIYGTPGETAEDFAATLRAAAATDIDHLSAYSLIVEPGTALARRVRAGEVPQPSDDVAADRYLAAEEILSQSGFSWYEVSNWARGEEGRCRHNVLYWDGGHWWGAGPGAHSHLPGIRWWNVKHPATYGQRLADGLAVDDGEELTDSDHYLETIMLRTRLSTGLPLQLLSREARAVADRLADDGLVVIGDGRLRLTLRGRLLADAVIRDLTV